LDKYLTPGEVRQLVNTFTSDIKIDPTLYDHSQILRITGTKHPKSGLYKIPLTFEQFFNDPIDRIKDRASSLDNIKDEFSWKVAKLPQHYFVFKKEAPKAVVSPKAEQDQEFANKPKQWRNCKWSLLQGNFKSGERDQVMMILASTCRGLGFDKETTYYMCKSALKKSWAKYGEGGFTKEELWNNVIENQIFSDRWNGGQYSCKSDMWLQRYCDSLGEHKCGDREDEKPCIELTDMFSQFKSYASNFEQNIIKTGLAALDDNAMLLASTLNGLLGQPGAGKTSMALNYLKNASENGIPSIFLSLDMGMPIVYSKLIQKRTGMGFKDVLTMFKDNPQVAEKYANAIKEEYKNVGFNFKAGLTVPDIKKLITDHQDAIGKPVKLVVIDYLECLAGPYSDQLANTGFISNQLKDLANEMGVCILLLLQTQKHSTPDISDPLLSLKAVKGSSVIEQSMSVILTLWREGYNPETVEDDRYISFAVVKNRFGSLWKGDFSWQGVTGNINSLTEEQKALLKEFREIKTNRKLKQLMAKQDDWD
ncbi:MAG: hypothetical protein JNJ47_06540, partial [Alphaproteobacteria bacterium]|nr:hypothetical protein [Alphaproteobacteria bacterium]